LAARRTIGLNPINKKVRSQTPCDAAAKSESRIACSRHNAATARTPPIRRIHADQATVIRAIHSVSCSLQDGFSLSMARSSGRVPRTSPSPDNSSVPRFSGIPAAINFGRSSFHACSPRLQGDVILIELAERGEQCASQDEGGGSDQWLVEVFQGDGTREERSRRNQIDERATDEEAANRIQISPRLLPPSQGDDVARGAAAANEAGTVMFWLEPLAPSSAKDASKKSS
jgi:hypothetical protein